MTSEDGRFWDDIAPKYRALRGLCPMTPEEADAEHDNTPAIPLSESEIQVMVDAATPRAFLERHPKGGEE